MNTMNELDDGVFNKSADLVKRKDMCWSDTNFHDECTENDVFDRLKCRNCGGLKFEVLGHSQKYETMAQCCDCGMYFIIHTG